MNKDELLKLAYDQADSYIKDCGQEAFDCLLTLINDGTVTYDNINDYGIIP